MLLGKVALNLVPLTRLFDKKDARNCSRKNAFNNGDDGDENDRGNVDGQVETNTDSDGDCDRFSNDRNFYRDEEMLEELIVRGPKSGVDHEAFDSSNAEQPRSSNIDKE